MMVGDGGLDARRTALQLMVLGRERATGILTVQGPDEIVGISLVDGGIVAADALNRTMDDLLAGVLAERGLVTGPQFAELRAEHDGGAARPIELLVERGLLERAQVLGCVRFITTRTCIEVLGWTDGSLRFYPGDQISFEEGVEPLSVDELIVRATGEAGVAGILQGGLPDPAAVFAEEPDAVGSLAGGMPGFDLPPEVSNQLAEEEASLLRALDGRRTGAQAIQSAGLESFAGLLTLYRLQVDGRIVGRSPAQAAPPVRAAGPPVEPAVAKRAARVARVARVTRPEVADGAPVTLPHWVRWVLAAGLGAALLATLVGRPASVLYPFPWQGGSLDAHAGLRRGAVYLRIDESAKAYHLLEGRFPEALLELADRRLLADGDLADPATGRLEFASSGGSYRVHVPGGSEEPLMHASSVGTTSGNFLLDPDFVAPPASDIPPLVLLD